VSGSNGHRPDFSVGVSELIREQLRDISRRAAEHDMAGRVTAAFEEIIDRLERGARDFGEPLYHMRKMRMTVRNVAVGPLYIEYGVHDDQPVVVIRRVRWLADPAGS
jgi:hypothetical protein